MSSIDDREHTAPPPLPAGTEEHSRRCPRCDVNFGMLPPAAQFCPRCGIKFADAALEPPALNWSEWDRLLDRVGRSMDRPIILKGYARALSRLGWQYEVGHRVQRNYDEAVRCYSKAAQLGDDYAQERLRAIGDGERPS